MIHEVKENKLVSVVVYLYNNENQIVHFLESIAKTTNALFEKTEIIVVNDFSTDQSVQKIKESTVLKNEQLTILQMSFHQGLEIAMTAGVDLSAGDFVYEFDDITLDYDLLFIEKAYRKLIEGNDIVSVSPRRFNSFSSKLFYKVYNTFSKSKYKIRSDRFRVLSRRSINRAYSISIAIPYRKALYANSGLKNETLIYENQSNLVNTKSVFRNKMAINTLIIYTNLAFKISIGITLLLFLTTLSMIFYALIIYFGNYKPIEGWTTLMMIISGSFSGLFFLIAIIIKYLSLLLELVYYKKSYFFESIDKI